MRCSGSIQSPSRKANAGFHFGESVLDASVNLMGVRNRDALGASHIGIQAIDNGRIADVVPLSAYGRRATRRPIRESQATTSGSLIGSVPAKEPSGPGPAGPDILTPSKSKRGPLRKDRESPACIESVFGAAVVSYGAIACDSVSRSSFSRRFLPRRWWPAPSFPRLVRASTKSAAPSVTAKLVPACL